MRARVLRTVLEPPPPFSISPFEGARTSVYLASPPDVEGDLTTKAAENGAVAGALLSKLSMRVHHLDCCTMCPRGRSAINGKGSLFARARLVSHCLLIETDAHGLVLVDTGMGLDDIRDTRRLGPLFGAAMAVDGTKTRTAALPQVEALDEPWKGVPAVRQLEGLPTEILALQMSGHSRGRAAIAVDTGHGWLVHAGDAYFHRSVTERGDTSGMAHSAAWLPPAAHCWVRVPTHLRQVG